jgi:protocatechuate 3,4-dioxygenase beta subunit
MINELNYLAETSSQTAGPYVHIGLAPAATGIDIYKNDFSSVLAGPKTKGERIRIEGRVIDGSGTPLRDDPEIHVRRRTLIAPREARGGKVVYRFDIRLQGPDETVFFDA